MAELDVIRDDRSLRVIDFGDPHGSPVVYFHGTPGSRLDMSFADDFAAAAGIRIVAFDRPGYGHSNPSQFGLVSVAEDAAAVADHLGIDRFATLGQSGGGPFSLAAAAVLGHRVTRAGVMAGAGPFTLVPGAQELLDEGDTAALALLPDDVVGAAEGFAAGFEPLVTMFRENGPAEIMAGFHDSLSPRDRVVVQDERLALALGRSMKESLRQGSIGAGWDNVAWVGPWEIDPTTITRPVLLWYGVDDRFCPPSHAVWLHEHLPDSHLVLRPDEGHFGFAEHTSEILTALIS